LEPLSIERFFIKEKTHTNTNKQSKKKPMQNQAIKFVKNIIIFVATIAIVTLLISMILCFMASLVSCHSFVECFKSDGNHIVVFFTAIAFTIGFAIELSSNE
jgi:hypothetical protein